ncbi:DUF3558 domain-containing protein [Jongsikchunia kroppenstedtii]|uniref:DUF3558 domain-containing protein n=1 Tax=Jongsikchunia kroppenstedtii TaxID=1121721 RepID=UPI00036FEE9D|nr:DUF3558 domain-containing protein [Jongsikchunia kroppenstedtii]
MKPRSRISIATVAVLVIVVLLTGACSGGGKKSNPTVATAPTETGRPGAGPFLSECGGISTAELQQVVGLGDLTMNVDNSTVCDWTSASQPDAAFSFNWYRGSPIGRERATEQLSRDSVQTIKIGSGTGFIAKTYGLTEIGIAFGQDFFEWSVRAGSSQQGFDTQAAVTTLAQRTVGRATGAGDSPSVKITDGGDVRTGDYPQLQVECDRLNKDKLAEAVGGGYAENTFSGAICRWVVASPGGNVYVTFNWFETDNMPTEKRIAQRLGYTTENVKINEYGAFTQQNPKRGNMCGVTANAPTGGIYTWFVEGPSSADPCAAPTKLMELLLGNDF